MINFFKKPNEKVFNLVKLDADALLYKVFPRLFMEVLKKYFRLEVEGAENIPTKGPVIIAPNHSGFSGFDAMVLAYILQQETKRIPRVMTHRLWFLTEKTALPAQKMGFIEATFENGLSLLSRNNMVVLFPEGKQGNFKPTSKRYQLQEFKRGFVRMALKTGAPIVPTLIIGAEETHINLQQLKFSKFLRGLVLPLPLNVIPLPAKWKIIFHKPISLPFGPDKINDTEVCHDLAQEIQESMQKKLNKELKIRARPKNKKV
jgi:1-acyl-sn-glycerol-3-phosphate acyltransferase